MSTTVVHHQRSHLIAAAAAVLAVAALIGYNVSRDDAPASTNSPADTSSAIHFPLTGGTHEEGSWNHAGTTSGGHTPLDS